MTSDGDLWRTRFRERRIAGLRDEDKCDLLKRSTYNVLSFDKAYQRNQRLWIQQDPII